MSEIEQQQPAGENRETYEEWLRRGAARMSSLGSPDPQERGGATGSPEDLDNSPAYHTWWTSLPHAAMGWTPQHYGYAAWQERGRRDKAQLAERDARIAEVTAERDRLGVLDSVLKERRHHPDCEVFTQGECGCWLAAVLPVRYRALDQHHRPHHAVDAHTEGNNAL